MSQFWPAELTSLLRDHRSRGGSDGGGGQWGAGCVQPLKSSWVKMEFRTCSTGAASRQPRLAVRPQPLVRRDGLPLTVTTTRTSLVQHFIKPWHLGSFPPPQPPFTSQSGRGCSPLPAHIFLSASFTLSSPSPDTPEGLIN